MLTFNSVSLYRGPRKLLEGLSFTIYPGWRVGVVGRNGTGKSSLFAMVMGELGADSGDVSLPKNLQIATVAQETPALSVPAIEYVLDGDAEWRVTDTALMQAEADHDAAALAHLHDVMHAIDGYAARSRAARLLDGLGFGPAEQTRAVAEFSGGWRMRLNLARALMCRSDLLLLDEPTNHLDLDAVLWLQSWLSAYPGTLLTVSHDREFLDAACTHTLHLGGGTATLYTGNYSQFERLRAERMAQQSAEQAQQKAQVAHLKKFVERFKAKASKAKQAQSRLKMIERIELTVPAHADSEFEFGFATPERLPSPMVRLDEVSVGYDGHAVLTGLRGLVQPGDRIGLLGPNGAGKSTFVRLLAGELKPMGGDLLHAPYLNIGYFAQHQLEQLDPKASPLLHLQRMDGRASEQSLRGFLGGFNFRGDRVFEAVAPFSGGEKARLALAMVVYRKPNLLLLDEPTNHLDLDMRHALELALQDFEGSVLLVSHDRHLLASTCDTLWRVSDGQLVDFDGDLDDYARWLATRRQSQNAPVKSAVDKQNSRDARKAAANVREREKPLRNAVKKFESEISKLNAQLRDIGTQLDDPDVYSPAQRTRLTHLTRQQLELRKQLSTAEEGWLTANEELEALRA